jgi:uncharacterized protein (DUF1800 family)
MERMDSNYSTTATPLRAVFESARQFGLSDEDVLGTFDETLRAVGEHATMSEYLDELNGTLARCILARERERSRRGC